MDNIKFIDCVCSDPEHILRFERYDLVGNQDPDEDCLVIYNQFNNSYGFFKRIWIGIKFIFSKYEPRWGSNWNATLLSRRQTEELARFLLTELAKP